MSNKGWRDDQPGGSIAFHGAVLERNNKTDARNPYMNILVDGDLIGGHNHISGKRIQEFARQLILINTQSGDDAQKEKIQSLIKAKAQR